MRERPFNANADRRWGNRPELDQATIGGCLGLPSHLLRLADGRALMTYGHRRPLSATRPGSVKMGDPWSAPISLSTDGASGDLGYPSTAQLTDGSLVSVHERLANHPKAVLRQARWSLEA